MITNPATGRIDVLCFAQSPKAPSLAAANLPSWYVRPLTPPTRPSTQKKRKHTTNIPLLPPTTQGPRLARQPPPLLLHHRRIRRRGPPLLSLRTHSHLPPTRPIPFLPHPHPHPQHQHHIPHPRPSRLPHRHHHLHHRPQPPLDQHVLERPPLPGLPRPSRRALCSGHGRQARPTRPIQECAAAGRGALARADCGPVLERDGGRFDAARGGGGCGGWVWAVGGVVGGFGRVWGTGAGGGWGAGWEV
jgi:hypothetical protein